MSKIGRKPIIFSSATIVVQDNVVTITGGKNSFVHRLPEGLFAELNGKSLAIKTLKNTRRDRVVWGLHRALIANKVKGVETGFEQKMTIVGLGYKAQVSGRNVVFTLGYTHKIDYVLPEQVSLDVDKTGQIMMLKSIDKFVLGNACDAIRSFRPPEPYKGTGIIKEGEVVIRKAGKTKAG